MTDTNIAAAAPLRKNGQIKLYGETGFAGMRKAGQLVGSLASQVAS
mgnify:CR=1 FL=1